MKIAEVTDVTRVEPEPRANLGTRLVKENFNVYRYGRAGEDLQPEVFVEPDISEEDRATLVSGMERSSDIIFGNVVASIGDPNNRPSILGYPLVAVKKGYYFWIRTWEPQTPEFIEEKE